jgi:hypothetical protein
MRKALLTTCIVILISIGAYSQGTVTGSALDLPAGTASKFLGSITNKFNKLQGNITKQTEGYLDRLEKQEKKLYRKLQKKDSTAAKKLFEGNAKKYAAMRARLHAADSTDIKLKEYLPHYDTLKTSLAFMDKAAANSPEIQQQLGKAKAELQQFGSKMQVANEIKKQIRERKQQLNEQLQRFGMGKDLMAMNKEVYYYQQQLNEYRAMLNDPKKIEQKAIAALKGMLAQLFKLPDNYGSAESLAGLQTVASVQQLLNGRAAAGGPNAGQAMQQGMQQAQAQLKSLKDKINKLGGNSSSVDMPSFTPNKQKTKTFLQRLEYGMNVQTQKVHGILPTTSDIALTAGYKLNDKSTIGIGASYKLGWGTGIKDIHLSSQGMGLRSYVDIKLKGNLWISGGYEQNYLQAFSSYEQLYNIKAWQQSGLIGLTKKYRIGKKTNSMQVLWDFLSYSQQPRAEAIKFRIGYKL